MKSLRFWYDFVVANKFPTWTLGVTKEPRSVTAKQTPQKSLAFFSAFYCLVCRFLHPVPGHYFCSHASQLLDPISQQNARTWMMIWGQICGSANLLINTKREFMAAWSPNLAWRPLWNFFLPNKVFRCSEKQVINAWRYSIKAEHKFYSNLVSNLKTFWLPKQ